MTDTLINGVAAAHVSVADRGLNYGDGLFETIACVGSRPLFLEQHLQRMERGAGILDIRFPERELLLSDIEAVLGSRSDAQSVVKLVLTRGQGQRGYRYEAGQAPTRICLWSPWPEHVARWQRDGIRARFCDTPASTNPRLAGIKSLNRLENVLASGELGREFDEGFLCDSDGHVVEGTMSNLFTLIDDTLVTPDLSRSGIAGIMRQQIIDCADEIGIGIETGRLSHEDLLNSDEIFISNSVIGLCVLKQLEQQPYDRHMTAEAILTRLKTKIQADAETDA